MAWEGRQQRQHQQSVKVDMEDKETKHKHIVRALVIVGIMAGLYWLATHVLPGLVGLTLVSK